MKKIKTPEFIEYNEKKILHIIYPEGVREDVIIRIMEEALSIIIKNPESSILTLTEIENFEVTPRLILHFREYNQKINPYIKASAVLGLAGLKKTIFNALKTSEQTKTKLFQDKESALEYLAAS